MGEAPCRTSTNSGGGIDSNQQQEEEAEASMAVAPRGSHGDAVKWLCGVGRPAGWASSGGSTCASCLVTAIMYI